MSKSEVQVLDFDKICRLCLLEKRSMSSIFSKKKSDKKVPLPVRIMSCASLELYEGDGLPSSICNKCLLSVNQSYAFREQCEQADTTLRQYAQRLQEASEEASTNPFLCIEEFFEKFNLKKEDEIKSENNSIDSDEVRLSDLRDECVKAEKMDEVCYSRIKKEPAEPEIPPKLEETSSDLLKKLSLNSGITITKKSVDTTNVPDSKNDRTWKFLKELTQRKAKRNDKVTAFVPVGTKQNGKAISKIFDRLRNAQTVKPEKPSKSSEERKRKGFTTARFFEEYAANAEEVKVRRSSSKDDRVYCKVCKIFIGRPYFYNHVKYVHKNVRNHLCQDCGYRAQTGHILRQHIESQHSGTILPCSECSMSFTCAKRLRFHVNKHHSGKPVERKHICQYCGKAFTTPHYLKNHIRVHTQETPYECSYCDRKFKFKWACKTHERLHTGVKPYKCTYCGQAFTQNCVRKNHEYRSHGNEEFNPKNRIPKQGNRREKKAGKKSSANVRPIELVEVVTGAADDSQTKSDGL